RWQRRIEDADGVHCRRRHRERGVAPGRQDEGSQVRDRRERSSRARSGRCGGGRGQRADERQGAPRADRGLRNHRRSIVGADMLRRTGIFIVIAWSLARVASAQVAMLTQVTGDVRVSGKEGARPAMAFLKVNDGDTLTLTGNARVQMVYLATGRQEIWKG